MTAAVSACRFSFPSSFRTLQQNPNSSFRHHSRSLSSSFFSLSLSSLSSFSSLSTLSSSINLGNHSSVSNPVIKTKTLTLIPSFSPSPSCPKIVGGGGPRTFPGGVTKWQWKRMLEKKQRTIEKARLLRERESFEEQRRIQSRVINGIEKPWESLSTSNSPTNSPTNSPANRAWTRGELRKVPIPPIPESVIDRFDRRRDAVDLWNEKDGPITDNQSNLLTNNRSSFSNSTGFGNSSGFSNSTGVSNSTGFSNSTGASIRTNIDGRTDSVKFQKPDGSLSSRFFPSTAQFSTTAYRAVTTEFVTETETEFETEQDMKNGNGNGNGSVERSNGRKRGREGRTGGGGGEGDGEGGRFRVGNGGGSVLNGFKGGRESNVRGIHTASLEKADEDGIKKKGGGGSGTDMSFMTDVRFDSFPLSPLSIKALHQDLGYELCTVVQAATMPSILQGKDVLAKAKTGTGKTIAFLLPALESMREAEAKFGSAPTRAGNTGGNIRILVICPARELAMQVAEESKQLLAHHSSCGAQLVIGGTRMPAEVARLKKQPCQVLVGTPGRLLDHIQTTPGMKEQLRGLQVLIMDECDQLLDMGFRKALDGILAGLPKKRQTLLFSATLPNEVQKMAKDCLKTDHEFIDTVGEETSTNLQVKQESLVVNLEDQLPTIYGLLKQHMEEEENYKVLVFATTARQTQLMAELFQNLGIDVLEIHSRKSQSYRIKVSDKFRNSSGKLVMFTSDVSARGVDYPDVTFVLQVGVPSEKAQYVHRLGRTGRAGKEGRGVLLLSPWEKFFLRQLSDLPITTSSPPILDRQLLSKVGTALSRVESDTKEKAYQSWLGYYNSVKGLGWDKPSLVRNANFYSETLGLKEPPYLQRKTVGMMGLRGVPGLNVQ